MDEVDELLLRLRAVAPARSIAGHPGLPDRLRASARRRGLLATAGSAGMGVAMAVLLVVLNPAGERPRAGAPLLTAADGTML